MCINFNGSHSGGSSFVNVNDCWLFVYHKYKFSSEKKNNNNNESQYMVSHPETGSDSPIGSDQDRGRDNCAVPKSWDPCLWGNPVTHAQSWP